jgi:hypothetical protein
MLSNRVAFSTCELYCCLTELLELFVSSSAFIQQSWLSYLWAFCCFLTISRMPSSNVPSLVKTLCINMRLFPYLIKDCISSLLQRKALPLFWCILWATNKIYTLKALFANALWATCEPSLHQCELTLKALWAKWFPSRFLRATYKAFCLSFWAHLFPISYELLVQHSLHECQIFPSNVFKATVSCSHLVSC